MGQIALFSLDGILFVLRWIHFFFGIVWIGHLYYFNFTQGPFFNETDATTKSNAIQKLVPRALWWFRWGAMWTFVTGWTYLAMRGHMAGGEIFATSWGIAILTGATLGSLMWFNVWFVIWPNQKIVIANATDTAAGKPANPAAAGAATRAGIASRHNVLFSMPMLFFMGAASHLPFSIGEGANLTVMTIVLAVILGALQFNAMKGKMGPLASVKGVIHMGVVLMIVLYAVMELLT